MGNTKGVSEMRLGGAWTALVTPFDADGWIDWEGLNKNIEFQVSQGITGVVPVGTTGESPTLDAGDHDGVIRAAIVQCHGKCGLLAGTGSNSTKEALERTESAVEMGAEGVLLVDCYYNGPSSRELRDEYYAVVAERFPDTAIVPYVIPGRSGTALAVEDLAILASKHLNIYGVKEATGDLVRMARTRLLLGDRFPIMSGDDDLTFKMMVNGDIRADGVISVVSNVAPAAVAEMVVLVADGNTGKALPIAEALSPLFGIVTANIYNDRVLPDGQTVSVNDRYRNPLPIKTLMAGLGMPAGPCRRPLGKMSEAGVGFVRAVARKVWRTSPEILQPIGEFYGVDLEARIGDDAIWHALAC